MVWGMVGFRNPHPLHKPIIHPSYLNFPNCFGEDWTGFFAEVRASNSMALSAAYMRYQRLVWFGGVLVDMAAVSYSYPHVGAPTLILLICWYGRMTFLLLIIVQHFVRLINHWEQQTFWNFSHLMTVHSGRALCAIFLIPNLVYHLKLFNGSAWLRLQTPLICNFYVQIDQCTVCLDTS